MKQVAACGASFDSGSVSSGLKALLPQFGANRALQQQSAGSSQFATMAMMVLWEGAKILYNAYQQQNGGTGTSSGGAPGGAPGGAGSGEINMSNLFSPATLVTIAQKVAVSAFGNRALANDIFTDTTPFLSVAMGMTPECQRALQSEKELLASGSMPMYRTWVANATSTSPEKQCMSVKDSLVAYSLCGETQKVGNELFKGEVRNDAAVKLCRVIVGVFNQTAVTATTGRVEPVWTGAFTGPVAKGGVIPFTIPAFPGVVENDPYAIIVIPDYTSCAGPAPPKDLSLAPYRPSNLSDIQRQIEAQPLLFHDAKTDADKGLFSFFGF
jgi:hypothetical protein